MDREILFLKYLDQELDPDERLAVEKLLAEDPGALEMYTVLKGEREAVLSALDGLNPVDDSEVPAFKRPGPAGFFHTPFFRYAAASVILVGLALALWLVRYNKLGEEDSNQALVSELEKQEDALDCFISPNRCWSRREIPLIIIEIK
jgi:anti-sigma factor RsiW